MTNATLDRVFTLNGSTYQCDGETFDTLKPMVAAYHANPAEMEGMRQAIMAVIFLGEKAGRLKKLGSVAA